MDDKKPDKKKGIIILAIVFCIILYLAGVFSGLYANQLIRHETKEDINLLRKTTEQDLTQMRQYVQFLDSNLKDMQIEQTFMNTLDREQMCTFSVISLNATVGKLRFYWERLPFRLEEYERNTPILPEEYLLLKEQYALLSVRTWILAKSQYENCNADLIHGLYFYAANCDECVRQGEELDAFNKRATEFGRDVILFPIDYYFGHAGIENLKAYYNITSTPALLINSHVLQGRLFTVDDLLEVVGERRQ